MKKDILISASVLVLILLLGVFGSEFFIRVRTLLSYDFAGAPPPESVSSAWIAEGEREGIRAFVYSEYPFNFKNEILISRGSSSDVREGQPVIYRDALIGITREVFEEAATVQTIFDPAFKLPVRIGESGTDALLTGGITPEISLIPEQAPILKGDAVISSGSAVPYGTFIGRAHDITIADDKLFRKAALAAPYPMYEIREVLVIPLVRKK